MALDRNEPLFSLQVIQSKVQYYMNTWTYTIIPMIPDSDEINANATKFLDLMNELGSIGYELVCVHNDCLIFKKLCPISET